jgi:L-threonylcarbamoyladenylate synthase
LARILPLEDAFGPAIELFNAGQVVAIPTETVYGLAADATNGEAVARIFEVKGRPRFNPLIVHVSDLAMAQQIALFDERSLELASRYWPGPLTLVLPLRDGHNIHPLVSAGLDTVALRLPKGPAAELIARLGRPVAAPSANSSGRISPTTARAVDEDIGKKIDLILDNGPTDVGVESTIVKVTPDEVRLLRPGGVTADDISGTLGCEVLRGGAKGIEAPGMMLSHYAPNAAVRLDAHSVDEGEAFLAFGGVSLPGAQHAVATLDLSSRGDLREAAANLYAHMKALDVHGARTIAVAPIPSDGLGEAINDRLRRAAAPRQTSLVQP